MLTGPLDLWLVQGLGPAQVLQVLVVRKTLGLDDGPLPSNVATL